MRDYLTDERKADIDVCQTNGAAYFNIWNDRKRKRAVFDEMAATIKASAKQVEKWKEIPFSSRDAKRAAEETVFSSVEKLEKTVKRLKTEP